MRHFNHTPVLQTCVKALGRLGGRRQEELRDEIQVLQGHVRMLEDVRMVVEAHQRGRPDKAEEAYKWEHTWEGKANLTALQERLQVLERSTEHLQSKVGASMEALKREGTLPQEAKLEELSSCLLRRMNPNLYAGTPTISFMLQYFKRPWVVKRIVEATQKCSEAVPSELLVNVDNPAESQEWAELAHSTKGFVVPVFSDNIHEIRGYNRLAALARGKYLVILQDDEVLAQPCTWLRNLVTVFEKYPMVGAIGLKGYIWSFGDGNTHDGLYFRDPATRIETQFVMNADYAPLALRKSSLRHIGGIDETMSEAGECGIFSDWELCTRLWLAGYQVMYMPRPPKEQDTHTSGTHKPETADRCWGKQGRLASGLFWWRYGEWDSPVLTAIADRVKQLNADLLEIIDPQRFAAKCPFRSGCEVFKLPAHT